MTVALMSVAPPGSTVATEAIGHHTLVPLATYLGFNLRPADRRRRHVPEALDEACRDVGHPRGLRAALGDQSRRQR